MTKKKEHEYHCLPQERVLRLCTILAGQEVMGVAPTQLAKALNVAQPVITRDLWNLINAGFAEKLDSGNYRLGPKLVQIALGFQRGLVNIRRDADEIEQRYSRSI